MNCRGREGYYQFRRQQEQGQVSLLRQQGYQQRSGYRRSGYRWPGYRRSGYRRGYERVPGGGPPRQFLSGGFGRAIISGAGFGIADGIINKGP